MDRDKFEKLVVQAVESLPDEFRDKLANIDVVVEDRPSPAQLKQAELKKGFTLLGLYEGVPLTRRHTGYGMVAPDKITIFQNSIEAKFSGASDPDIQAEIQKVVLHEIAHHFGIGDARLKQIEDERK
jgi:predicted Zn-dependent protease with MMP-like domain